MKNFNNSLCAVVKDCCLTTYRQCDEDRLSIYIYSDKYITEEVADEVLRSNGYTDEEIAKMDFIGDDKAVRNQLNCEYIAIYHEV